MNIWSVFGLISFMACFAVVFLLNSGAAAVSMVSTNSTANVTYSIAPIQPPYRFVAGDTASQLNAYFFVFIFSLLFFGFSAFLAMGVEGLKYASFFSSGNMAAYDLLFVAPQILAMIAAAELGEGIMNDFEARESIFENENWKKALFYLAFGFVLTVVLAAARSYALPLLSP